MNIPVWLWESHGPTTSSQCRDSDWCNAGEETQGPARAVNHRLYYWYSSAGQRGTEKCSCLPGLEEMHVSVYESVKALKTFLFETGGKK